MRFEILGPVRAFRDGGELDLGPGKQRAVLAVLLSSANKPVATTQIVDAVWGEEPPENGANVVQKYVAGLRRVLEPHRSPRQQSELLALTDAGYVLSVREGRLDADAFDDQVRQVRRLRDNGQVDEAAKRLRDALLLWRAEPLAGMTGPFFDGERRRLAERRGAALELWAAVELQLGRHVAAVPEIARLVSEYPLREELRYQHILALYRCGRQAEALAAYREARRYLDEEFGVEPGERLQELHRRILQSDATLATPPPVTMPLEVPAGVPVPPPAMVYVPWQPYLPAPLEPTPQRNNTGLTWFVGLSSVLAPVFTCGTLGWAVIVFHAAWRRSIWIGASAAAYLAVMVFGWTAILNAPEDMTGPWDDLGVIGLFLSVLGPSVHGGVLGFTFQNRPGRVPYGAPPPRPAPPHLLVQQVRREQARQLISSHPSIARELHIGRPDLPRAFDDGGLVDVNSAPAQVLATLPGITPDAAQRIVVDRELRGRLGAVDDLITRQLLPPYVVHMLREELIALT